MCEWVGGWMHVCVTLYTHLIYIYIYIHIYISPFDKDVPSNPWGRSQRDCSMRFSVSSFVFCCVCLWCVYVSECVCVCVCVCVCMCVGCVIGWMKI
jgi:hypothetical protein